MKKKKLLSILLSAALAFSLTACGNSNNEAQTSNSASSSTSTPTTASKDASSSDADASTDTAEADPFGKYADPLEIHFVRATDDTIETNVLANLPGQTLEDNFWLDTYEDELGIKIVYDWIVKGDDEFNQKMNVSMASEELPDVMCVTATQMMQLIDAGLVQEMGPVFEQYATDFTKEVMNQEGDSPFLAGQKDGVQYGLPVTGGSVDSVDLMWIRTDWLEKLNLEVPTTMDEVLTMVDQFVNADFDGNGAKDTVGIGVAGTSMLGGGFGGLRGFFNAYGAYQNRASALVLSLRQAGNAGMAGYGMRRQLLPPLVRHIPGHPFQCHAHYHKGRKAQPLPSFAQGCGGEKAIPT